MSRITSEQVKKVIDTDIEDISLFIETADLIVTEQLEGKGLADDRLAKIELYLAAHFITLTKGQLKSEKFGDASQTYDFKLGMNLQASLHGQMAVTMDTSSTLANMGNSKAEITLL